MKRILSVLTLLLLLIGMLTGCGLRVPRPEIKSGEFKYSVTYEYNGEINTVSGIYVCEYAGLSWALDGGYSRDWSGYIKGADDNDHIELGIIDDGDVVILVLSLSPEYFMDDFNFDLYDAPAPYIMIKDYTEDGGLRFLHEADLVEELCGAKIISYEYDAPIENTFALFDFN